MGPYDLLKFTHVFLAILAVGSNLTYAVWITRARSSSAEARFVLQGIKFLDNRIANPAYILLLVTGLAMVFVGGLSLTIPWLLTSLVLYAIVAGIGVVGYSRVLRKQTAALEAHGVESEEYRRLAALGLRLGVLLVGLVVIIVFLMVTKPTLWA